MIMNENLRELPTPAVVIDLDMAEENIRVMQKNAEKHGLAHRPHIKTHRAGYFAKKQIEMGCKGITCAKLGEAEIMADDGIKDIFIAYPIIGEDKLQRLYQLAKRVKVSTIVNSLKGARDLSTFFTEINGLMYYGGLIYGARNIGELEEFTRKEHDDLVTTAELLKQHGFQINVLSAGSSFSGKKPELLEGITEIRSGHYIFNDCGQLDIGLASPEQCALNVVTTVVAKPDDHTVICDVGTKSLTSDQCHYREGYGYVMEHPEIQIYSLNEEHAFLRTEEENPLQVGDKIAMIPNHACVVTNLAEKVYGFRNGKLDQMIVIDAKGKSV